MTTRQKKEVQESLYKWQQEKELQDAEFLSDSDKARRRLENEHIIARNEYFLSELNRIADKIKKIKSTF